MYLIYIKEIISSRVPEDVKLKNTNLKIGFAISIEKILLDNLVSSKEDLKELVYSSGLIKKDDDSKKLRITVLGEGMLSSIKQLVSIDLPVKSNFILAHIHENYIQITLNQAVTATNSENEQESIIIEDKIIYIQNVYDSLCLYVWNSLVYSQSPIQLCDKHSKVDSEELLSIKTKIRIVDKLKQYILDNILTETSNCQQTFYSNNFELNLSCNCRISLTTFDIIEIAFKPFLKDINCIMLSTLLNQKYFGRYRNIDYHVSLIYFNQNIHCQKIISDILKEDAIICNPMRGIDTICTVIPAFKVQPFSPQEFQTGVLYQVYNDSYAFSFNYGETDEQQDLFLKWKNADDSETELDKNVAYHFIQKDDILDQTKNTETAYIRSSSEEYRNVFIEIYRYNPTKDENYLKMDETWEIIDSYELFFSSPHTRAICIKARYIGYFSSLGICTKAIDEEYQDEDDEEDAPTETKIRLPMTLRRF